VKELITEEQADLIVLLLSIGVTLASFAYGFYRNPGIKKEQKKPFWAEIAIYALFGPVIWIFWDYIYNPIENFYGLDSLKALKINFFIAIVLFAGLFLLMTFVPRWIQEPRAPRRRK
jgi:hypothetical protein